MDQATCTFCQTTAPAVFKVGDLNRRLSDEEFTYYRCPNCQLIFLWPHPADLGKYYPNEYYSVPETLQHLETASAGEQYKVDIVREHIKTGRMLEVGSAYGGFAALAKRSGFEVEAIEMDTRSCEFMRSVIGIHVINEMDPVKALESAGMYDVIVLWQVIEHLPDPWSTLRALADHLNPSGFLIMGAPNPDAFQFHVQGRRWPHVDAPRHLTLIPVSVFRTHLERFALKLVAASTSDPGSIQWNRFGWRMWLGNLSTHPFVKRYLFKVGRLLTILASPIETRGLRGSTYTVTFQKS